MVQHPPAAVQHRTDVKSEIAHLLERLFELVEECPHPPASLRRSHLCDRREENTVDPLMVHLETEEAFYLIVKCAIGPGRTTLSPREQEIVRLVSNGHPNKAIARQLAISQHTVNTHVRRIFDKLGVSSRAEMVAYALQSGLVGTQTPYN
ncbi:MAG: helix-turn-helix transcriptional regulator [Chloroflexi bacterium]|nr:MAG: helix-turn-helix transcriptional regulator [Chloroflexota bacterium]